MGSSIEDGYFLRARCYHNLVCFDSRGLADSHNGANPPITAKAEAEAGKKYCIGKSSSSLTISTSFLAGGKGGRTCWETGPDSQIATISTRQYFFPGPRLKKEGDSLAC